METYGIDPYRPETWPEPSVDRYSDRCCQLERPPSKQLRRSLSERDLSNLRPHSAEPFNYYGSAEQLPTEKKKKRRKSFSFRVFNEELEYGPGIVERLKAKFHRLSGLVSRDAKVSPHATGKRCPSMDDILSSAEEEPLRTTTALSARSSTPLSPLSKRQSQSTGDMLDAVDERRTFLVHRTINLQPDEYPDTKSISALRRKFEINVHRRPSQNLRHVKNQVLSTYEPRIRPTSIDLSHQPSPIPFNKDVPPPRLRLAEAPARSTPSPTTEYIGHTVSMLIPDRNEVEAPKMLPLRITPVAEKIISPVTSPQSFAMFGSRPEAAQNDYRKPFRVLEVLNHASNAKVHENNNDDEPEFIKIGRRLRKNSVHLEDLEHLREFAKERFEASREEPVRAPEPDAQRGATRRVPFIRRNAEIPKLSSQASIVTDDFYKDTRVEIEPPSRSLDMMSPPDPDSARQRTSPSIDSNPTVFVRTDDIPQAVDASPPPEEPRPPQEMELIDGSSDYAPRDRILDMRPSPVPLLSSPQILPHNSDDSGVMEMQRILNRFRKTRDERHTEATKIIESPEMIAHPEQAQPNQPQQRPFVHAIVGVRPSTAPADRPLFIHRAMNLSRPNVVNISVKSEVSAIHNRKCLFGSALECQATAPFLPALYAEPLINHQPFFSSFLTSKSDTAKVAAFSVICHGL
ncbi:hypothetical protein OESDEN_00018 [Oesophagostomum dentatum]|uniref:Uncharacterized protein n=1 Tax=Oesophagostomum dentatum TaxID=61180 RepID=A0A0B1TWU4_OESDE|nr:hypothetical protein OESDEN_00018 [Oesophagostomum dentatum]